MATEQVGVQEECNKAATVELDSRSKGKVDETRCNRGEGEKRSEVDELVNYRAHPLHKYTRCNLSRIRCNVSQ